VEQRRTFEISTASFDPSFQLRSSGPQGAGTNIGLLIPAAPSISRATRYLFALAGFGLSGAQKARIRGIRQLLTIGGTTSLSSGDPPVTSNLYNVEQQVTTPMWRFADGNVSWHLLRIPPGMRRFANAANGNDQMFRFAKQSALLFESPPVPGPYVAPWGGQLPAGGKPIAGLGQFYDVRFPWWVSQGWSSVDFPIEGPCSVVFFASVWQTNPSARPTITPSTSPVAPTLGLPPEENFLLSLPLTALVRYWRIAGSLIVEEYGQGGGDA
jgi:hypothetical protein